MVEKGLSIVRVLGEDMIIFISDQQLYKITLKIQVHQPSYFKSVIPVLGGGIVLMNFIMSSSGIKVGLASTSGKKYPQTFCALRILMKEVLYENKFINKNKF
jgi:hypothetical protein